MTVTEHASSGNGPALSPHAGASPMTFDSARYRHHVDRLNMPEERKEEVLRAVWQIMRTFVDCAFGDDAAQLARKHGDELHVVREARLPTVVGSKDHNNLGESTLSAVFKKRAARERRKEKR